MPPVRFWWPKRLKNKGWTGEGLGHQEKKYLVRSLFSWEYSFFNRGDEPAGEQGNKALKSSPVGVKGVILP